MTIKIVNALRDFCIAVAAGALLLSAQLTVSTTHRVNVDQVDQAIKSADVVSPNTFHHWPTAGTDTAIVVADLVPNTFHHWN